MQFSPIEFSCICSASVPCATYIGIGIYFSQVQSRLRSTATAVSVHDTSHEAASQTSDWDKARPYSEVPGPKPLPLIGNTFRFFPAVGG